MPIYPPKCHCMEIVTYFSIIFINYCQVESYVAHIRGILEERECQTAEYAQDNEQLRQELHHIRQQQGELCTDAAR